MSNCPDPKDIKILGVSVFLAACAITLITTHSIVYHDAINEYPEDESDAPSTASFSIATVISSICLIVCTYFIVKKSMAIHNCSKSGSSASATYTAVNA